MRSTFAAACVLVLSSTALASSHREAPFITKNPKVDNTDFYMFNSYEASRGSFVTLIANFQPLQAPYGGPNYFTMDSDALYEIHVDNTGDAIEDLTFQFKFTNDLVNGVGIALPIAQPDGGGGFPGADGGGISAIPISLINAGPIGAANGTFTKPGTLQGLNEHFTVGLVNGPRRATPAVAVTNSDGGTTFDKPFENVGSKTFPANSYANYVQSFMYNVNIPGCTIPARMFVGTRKEGFAVNLGPIFDLINAPPGLITAEDAGQRSAGGANPIGYANVTTIALEIDHSCLINAAGGTVIGGWSTASVRQARVVNPAATYDTPSREGGAWVQVSRLGMPLVNEVVIGLPDKDRFNSSEPKDDAANFAKYVFNPTLPTLLEVLFGTQAPKVFPRQDLVTAFLTGIPGVNKFNGTNAAPTLAEFVRLNTALGPTALASQNSLGALECFQGQTATTAPGLVLPPTNMSCDPAGFPNGRRPGDDTVDITLRVAMGWLQDLNDAPSGNIPFHDAILQQASDFDPGFPYMKNPNPGVP